MIINVSVQDVREYNLYMSKGSNDRRAVHSRSVIKDAFLSLLEKKNYTDLNITDICNEAEISRSTFYQHYSNMHDVLDAILSDVFSQIGNLQTLIDESEAGPCSVPLCVFIRQNRKYMNLLTDTSLSDSVIERYRQLVIEPLLDSRRRSDGLYRTRMENILIFQISGCLNAIRHNMYKSDEEWNNIRSAIDEVLLSGMKRN